MASKRFKVVSSKHKSRVEDGVSVLLNEGYELSGGLSVCITRIEHHTPDVLYSQAMVLE